MDTYDESMSNTSVTMTLAAQNMSLYYVNSLHNIHNPAKQIDSQSVTMVTLMSLVPEEENCLTSCLECVSEGGRECCLMPKFAILLLVPGSTLVWGRQSSGR